MLFIVVSVLVEGIDICADICVGLMVRWIEECAVYCDECVGGSH